MQNNPDKVQYTVDRFMAILNTGLYVHALYARFTNITDAAKY